ncbi:MAG: hypothetical protein ACT4TC_01700 [Myxococcaceae bacterium]
MRLHSLLLLLVCLSCATPSAVQTPASEPPEAIVTRFLAAVDAKDFPGAYRLLSARWRGRYTPEQLRADFDAEPSAGQRLDRIRAALSSPFQVTPEGAQLVLGEGKVLRLIREAESYRVASLE